MGFALVAACSRSAGDRVLKEVVAPVRVQLKTHASGANGYDEQACARVTGIERFRCWFDRGPGCLYLSIDEPTDGDCDLPEVGSQVSIAAAADNPVGLEVDSTGERIAVRIAENRWLVLYLDRGVVLARSEHESAWPPGIDWAKVKPVDDSLDEMFNNSNAEQRARLASRLLARGGEQAMATHLLESWNGDFAVWQAQLAALSPENQRVVREGLAAMLSADAGTEAGETWGFLARHAELRPPDFVERVAALAVDAGDPVDFSQLDWAVELLAREKHPAAAQLACRAVEASFFETLYSSNGEALTSWDNLPRSALAVLATERAPCEWLSRWVNELPCAAPLSCVALDGEEGLCTAAQRTDAVAKWRARTNDEDDELPPAPAFFAAAVFAQKNKLDLRRARRTTYKILDTNESACFSLVETLPTKLCALPRDVTEFSTLRCHVHIDDTRETVTLRALRVLGAE